MTLQFYLISLSFFTQLNLKFRNLVTNLKLRSIVVVYLYSTYLLILYNYRVKVFRVC